MNIGIIATRYATALLELVDETGSGSVVVQQVETVCRNLAGVPEFQRDIENPSVPASRKIGLFDASLEGKMAPDLRKFVGLLVRNGRVGYARRVFMTFINEYYRSRHIKRATLIIADPELLTSVAGRPSLESRLRALIEKETGDGLILKTKVDPSLIGGFVFEVEDTVLDASVLRQIDVIRHQLKEMNRRIV